MKVGQKWMDQEWAHRKPPRIVEVLEITSTHARVKSNHGVTTSIDLKRFHNNSTKKRGFVLVK